MDNTQAKHVDCSEGDITKEERIKLIGSISDCDTQTLLNSYIDIFGIDSLRPFLVTSFIKSIPSPSNTIKKKIPSLPQLPPKLIVKNKNNKTHTHQNKKNNNYMHHNGHSNKNHSSKKIKNGRNFAKPKNSKTSTNAKHNKNRKNNQLQSVTIASTNQPLPSRTTTAIHPTNDAIIDPTQHNTLSNGHIHNTVMNGYHNGNGTNHHHNHRTNNNHNSRSNSSINTSPPSPFVSSSTDENDENEKEDEKVEIDEKSNILIAPIPLIPNITPSFIHYNITIPVKLEILNRSKMNKYFNLDTKTYPQDLCIFKAELPDDLYMKIFSWLDFQTVYCKFKLVSRSWFHMASQPSSLAHFKCLVPIPQQESKSHIFSWHSFALVRKLDISSKYAQFDDWTQYRKVLDECSNVMRDIDDLKITFSDFSFYDYKKHPLKKLFKRQHHLLYLELNAAKHETKMYDIGDVVNLLLTSRVMNTLKSFIVRNFVMKASVDELFEINRQDNEYKNNEDNNAQAVLIENADDIVMMKSAKLFGEFLKSCKNLETFHWFYDNFSSLHNNMFASTCHGIYASFVVSYLKYLNSHHNSISRLKDLYLPSFPHFYRNKTMTLYNGICSTLHLEKFCFRGDLGLIDWKTFGVLSPNLLHMELSPAKATNQTFVQFFEHCGKSLISLSVNTRALASSSWFQNDELTNFIIPYFRIKQLGNIEVIQISVNHLTDLSLFSFLLKCKSAPLLTHLSIHAQSFNGILKNADIKKYIGQYVTSKDLEFKVTSTSLYTMKKRMVICHRNAKTNQIRIDKKLWKQKKIASKLGKTKLVNELQQSLSMKIADIHTQSGQPRYE